MRTIETNYCKICHKNIRYNKLYYVFSLNNKYIRVCNNCCDKELYMEFLKKQKYTPFTRFEIMEI